MAISDQISRLQSSKSSIKSSIEGKGVSVPADAKLDVYNTYIDQIKTQGLYESKQVTPTAEGSIVLPSEGYDALSQVIIDGDMNLAPANIKKDVNIFGVTGTLEAKANLQTKQVTPTASGTTVTADEGYDGLSEVNVLGDSNLISSNIKKDVSIFGVNGSYEGSGGGSTDYNVYVQNSEPTSKNGVWIKGSSYSGKVYFSPTIAKQGTFLDGNFSFMNQSDTILGQCIVGDYMYVFGTSANTSYRYSLKNLSKTTISAVPLLYANNSGIRAIYCEKHNSIYVCYLGYTNGSYQDRYLVIYEYDIGANNFTQVCNYEIAYSSSGDYCQCIALYDDKIQAYIISAKKKLLIDIDTKVQTTLTDFTSQPDSRAYGIFYSGKYIYSADKFYGLGRATFIVRKYDITTNTTETKNFNNIFTDYLGTSSYPSWYIAILGDKVYVFFYSNKDRRLIGGIFDWNTGVGEVITSDIYMPSSLYPTHIYRQAIMPTLTTDKVYWHWNGFDTWAFQMAENNTEGLTNNSALIIQDLSGLHTTTIEDSARLTIGIKDAYIVNSNNLESKTTFYGDGEKWILLKNPTGETATVTFNTNGGSTIPSEQVVIGQKISAPSTPSKANYVFDDWYLNGEPFDFNKPIVEDITLVAGWETYEVIEYIESTGTQYIDTGVKGSIKNKIELDLQYVGDVSKFQINGLLWGDMRNDIGLYNSKVFWGVSTNSVTSNTNADNGRHTYFIDCTNGSYGMDGTTIGSVTPATVGDSGKHVLLGARGKYNTDPEAYCYERIYGGKYYIDGILARNFIPIKTEKGAVGLLDQVNNLAYYNVGTGTFIAGNGV